MFVHQCTMILTFLHKWSLPDRFLKYSQKKFFTNIGYENKYTKFDAEFESIEKISQKS
jgi:hypothetical protein